MKLLARIEPQPPQGIKYMLGGETWMPPEKRSPLRLHCEEWGNLGPMELNPEIQDNGHGFRVRGSDFIAPKGALGFALVEGVYYWTDVDSYGRSSIGESVASVENQASDDKPQFHCDAGGAIDFGPLAPDEV